MLQGKNIIIKANVSGTMRAVGASKSCSIDIDVETIKISSPTNGAWESSIPYRKSWKMTTNHLLTGESLFGSSDSFSLYDVFSVGDTYNIQMIETTDGRGLQGQAILKSFKITATKGNLCQGSFVWEGTGPLTIYE